MTLAKRLKIGTINELSLDNQPLVCQPKSEFAFYFAETVF
jgi:hypothetical protein